MIIYYTKEGRFKVHGRFKIPYYKLHRENGPAVTYSNRLAVWYINGKRHREDGPAVSWYGDKKWYVNGKLHRADGPAAIYQNGRKEWWQNGKLHRIDGAAVEFNNGYKYWYINDKELNAEEVETWIKNNNINLKTKKHQALFMLKFG